MKPAAAGARTGPLGGSGVAALLVLNVVLGIAVTVKGATVPGTMAFFDTDAQGVGLMFAWVTIGGMLAVVVGGWVSDVLGPRVPVVLGLGLSVVTFAVFGQARSMVLAQLLLLGTGLGTGFLQAGCVALCAQTGGDRGRSLMNLSQSLYGVGAVLGPVLAAGVLAGGLGWQAAYQATAAISLVCVLAVGLLPRAAGAPRTGGDRVPLRSLGRGLLWALALLGALETTVEVGLGEWTSELFVRRFGWTPDAAALAVSLYWIGIATGRLVVGLVGHRVRPARLIVAACLAVPPVMLGYVVSPWPLTQCLLAFAVGLALAPIFPTLLAWGGALTPRAAGLVSGFLAAASVGGASVLRPAMTVVATRSGLTTGFLVFVVISLVMVALAMALARRDTARPTSEEVPVGR